MSGVGRLTHTLIADHAWLAASQNPTRFLLPLIHGAAKDIVQDMTVPANRVLVSRATALALRYLTDLAPAQDWTLLATEKRLGVGRADLVWEHITGLVLIDEIKTSTTVTRIDPKWVAQVLTHVSGARVQYGVRVIGARILPLTSPGLATLIGPDGRQTRLDPVPADPCRLRGAVA